MEPDDLSPAESAEQRRLAGVLADPAVWVEPPAGLQESIVAAIAESRGRSHGHRRLYAVLGAAAAVVLAVSLAVGLNRGDEKRVEFASALTGAGTGTVKIVKMSGGWEIHLHASGLPRRDDGEYYQAWMKNAEGELVAVGTFNEPDDVTLWAGVAPTAYPTFTVTRQRAADGPESSGQVVLVGKPHRTSD